MPLAVFMILGTLQLFMILQGRIMAEYAAFRATRVGSTNQGECQAMTDAALVALMPTYNSFLGPGTPGGTPGEKLANAYAMRRTNRYAGARDAGHTGSIVWVIRERPLRFTIPSREDVEWDAPGNLMRLETRLVYWFPLRIPFANWVVSRMYLASFGLMTYTAMNPLMPAQKQGDTNWEQTSSITLAPEIINEIIDRYNRSPAEYVLPIQASSTMRMMSPAKASFFTTQNCPPAPETL